MGCTCMVSKLRNSNMRLSCHLWLSSPSQVSFFRSRLCNLALGMPVLCRRLGEREGETGRESNRRRKDETKSDCCLPDVKACVCAEDRRC